MPIKIALGLRVTDRIISIGNQIKFLLFMSLYLNLVEKYNLAFNVRGGVIAAHFLLSSSKGVEFT